MSEDLQLQNVIRSPNSLEWSHVVLSDRNISCSVCVSSRYEKPLLKTDLFRALRKVILTQPWLLANLFYKSVKDSDPSQIKWALIDELDLTDIVEFKTTTKSAEDDSKSPLTSFEVLQMSATRFAETNKRDKPLWKIIVYNNIEVCLLFSHAIMDGMSAMKIQRLLLHNLRLLDTENANLSTIENNYTKITPADFHGKFQFPPDSNNLITYKPSLSFLLFMLLIHFLPQFLLPKSQKQLGIVPPLLKISSEEKELPIPEKVTCPSPQVAIINLSSAETAKIMKECKLHNVTVTSFLSIIMAEAVSHFSGQRHMQIFMAANSRKCISDLAPELNGTNPDDVLGAGYSALMASIYNKDHPKTLSGQITKFNETLKVMKTPENLKTRSMNCFSRFDGMYKYTEGLFTSDSQTSLCVSNLGYQRTECIPNSRFNVERMTFFNGSPGNPLHYNIITTNSVDDLPLMTISVMVGDNLLRASNQTCITSLIEDIKRMVKTPDLIMNGRKD